MIITTSYRQLLDDLQENEYLYIQTRAITATIFPADNDHYIVGTHLAISGGQEMQPGLHLLNRAGTVTIMGRLEENNAKWVVCKEKI